MDKETFKEAVLEIANNEISKKAWAEIGEDINLLLNQLYTPTQDIEDAAMDLIAFVEDRGFIR